MAPRTDRHGALPDPADVRDAVRRSCTLIGDVLSLVYSALGGELTTRFVLKVAIVGLIAGTIFWYYLSDLRRDQKDEA